MSKSIKKSLLTFFLQEKKSICCIFSKGFSCLQALCVLMQLSGRFSMQPEKYFKRMKKISPAVLDLDSLSRVSCVAGRTDVVTGCQTSQEPLQIQQRKSPPLCHLPGDCQRAWQNHLGRAQKTFLLRLLSLERCYPLKESALFYHKTNQLEHQLQYAAESFVFSYPSSS